MNGHTKKNDTVLATLFDGQRMMYEKKEDLYAKMNMNKQTLPADCRRDGAENISMRSKIH